MDLKMTVLLVIYLSAMPLLIGLFTGEPHDAARALQLLLLPVGTSLMLCWGRPLRISGPFKICLAVACLLALCSIAAAPFPFVALREIVLDVSLVVAVLWYAGRPLPMSGHAGLAIGQALHGTAVLIVLSTGLIVERVLDYGHSVIGYENIRFLNHAQTIFVPLFLGMLDRPNQHRHLRRLIGYTVVISICIVSILQARATAVALMAAVVVAPILFGREGRLFSRRLFQCAVGGCLLHVSIMIVLPWIFGIELPPSYRPDGEAGSIAARIFLLKTAWSDVVAHPWLGVGPMHFAHYCNGEAAHPHNIYAQVAAEFGLPMACLIGLAAATGIWRAARKIRTERRDDRLAIGAFMACLAAMVDGCFSGNFVMPVSQMWLVLAVSLLIFRLRDPTDVAVLTSKMTVLTWRMAMIALLAAQLWLVRVSYPEWRSSNPVISVGPPIESEHYSPRFWRDGWF